MDISNLNVEFTYDWYDRFLTYLDEKDFTFLDYHEDAEDKGIFLRHDVDWSPRKAVKIARIEADMGVYSTYLFMLTSPFYNVLSNETRELISRISDLGHNIGLHFNTSQYWEDYPSETEIEETVTQELSILSSITGEEVNTVSFHNPPSWVFRKEYKGFVSTYEPRFFNEIDYTADSNQRWRSNPPFDGEPPDKLQILTHPVLWGDDDGNVITRLTEERDYVFDKIEKFMGSQNDLWE